MDFLLIFFLIIYLLICWAVSAVGSNREIGSTETFFISLFLSPLIGLIVALVSSPKHKEETVEKWKQFADNAARKAFKEDYAGAIDNYKDASYELTILKGLSKKQIKQRDALLKDYLHKIEYLEIQQKSSLDKTV